MGVADIKYDYDFKAELERKVIETMDSAMSSLESGRMSIQAYAGMMKGIHKCTSGLVDGMLTVALDGELLHAPKEYIYSAVFTDGVTIMIVRYKHGEDKGHYLAFTDNKWHKRKLATDPQEIDVVKSAWRSALKMVRYLEERGYERLA